LATTATAAGRARGGTGAFGSRAATAGGEGDDLTGGFLAGAFRAAALTLFLAAFLTTLLAVFAALAAFAGFTAGRWRFVLARTDVGAVRRREVAFLAGCRRALLAVFARLVGDFFDFLDFAALVARRGPAARRPFARFAFALAMTLLVRSPRSTRPEAVGCVVRLVDSVSISIVSSSAYPNSGSLAYERASCMAESYSKGAGP